MNVDLCFSLIVPLKARRDVQSLVAMSAYYTLCLRVTVICTWTPYPRITVLRGHRVRVLQY